MELLKHPNKWWRNEARRLLAERQDKSVVPTVEEAGAGGEGAAGAGVAVGAAIDVTGWTTRRR